MNWDSFHRARRFARPSLGTTIAIYASSLVAAAAIVLLIVALGATIDLVTTRGNLSIPNDAGTARARAELQQLAGSPDRTAGDQVHYVGRGLLPAVWRLHGTWLGGPADRLYKNWTALEHNDNCLMALVVTGWCLSLVLAAALFILERTARVAAPRPCGGSVEPSISSRCSLARAICSWGTSTMSFTCSWSEWRS